MSGIECLHCHKTLAIPEWVNTDDYDGDDEDVYEMAYHCVGKVAKVIR